MKLDYWVAARPRSLRKASRFPCNQPFIEALPQRRRSRKDFGTSPGKPEAFRKDRGKAAFAMLTRVSSAFEISRPNLVLDSSAVFFPAPAAIKNQRV